MEYLYQWGLNIVLSVQGWGQVFLTPMKMLSFLGSVEFYLLILPFLYWSIDTTWGIRVAVILLTSDALNNFLKAAIHSGRPFWLSRQVQAYAFEYSFGMPSGHAQNSTAVLGLVAATLKRWWAWVICLLLIILIGISRIYLAVHYPQDVVLGWLIGFLLVWLFLRFEKPIGNWFTSHSLHISILVLFLISISTLSVGLLMRSIIAEWQIPDVWIENARWAFPEEETINPSNYLGLMLTCGVFFGLTAGATWLSKQGGFNAKGRWGYRILRYMIGVAGVVVLWFGIGSLLPEDAGWIGDVLNYVLFVLIGVWISALAPKVFLRLKLAEQRD